ncbi:OmpA family protein [Vibrio metschnikovii]|uniref:OmpA family protein n=1 Tax=Vibrio metschnikovii TaxID=28172 RepID=UPI0013028089|nr:OmpA family protein [Vibrio metschnikovii]EKO3571914.1 OmpA family protein [Vibrio metschnikovii]EKO3581038.1 OmpA family protein [Vibrio metschnikovii]EKO3588101.1 OmpA family protein [Vibrio metschnikovii]EKO3627217.1 OmpA family protein [Vibrio metschnikovii]EKO3716338.1 OmpA family protein [Vibrio metschnikovii]
MKKLVAMISASLMAASSSAMADVYLGGKLGQTWLNDSCRAGEVCEDRDTSMGAFLGYNLNEWLAVEAGYDMLGKFTGIGLADDRVKAITLAPKFTLSLSPGVGAYAKLGGAYVDYGDESDYSFLAAAGLEFNVSPNVSLRTEYQVLTDINNDQTRAEANTVSLGVSYRFGAAAQPTQVVESRPVTVIEEVIVVEEIVETGPVFVNKTYDFQRLDSSSFAFDSVSLNQESKQQLTKLVRFLNQYPQAKVVITGHTDATGPAAYNQTLSEKRAKAVADALVEQGIQPSRLTWRGEGETNPIASNSTAEGRELNRRVDITIPEFDYQVKQ